jgi:GT2 family glycosyltransferase
VVSRFAVDKIDDPKALIITVNFRQNQCTIRFLKSATQLEGFAACDLLIVNNNSQEESASSLQQACARFSNTELLQSPRNTGYFGAANWALRNYLEHRQLPEWVVVCNNDVVFSDQQFLLHLLKKNSAASAMLAPSITSGLTGHDENPSLRHRPSRFRMWRYRLWLSSFHMMWFKQWVSPFVRRARYALRRWTFGERDHGSDPIYAPSGSFLIFSRAFFEAGGFIDDGCFLYAEEFRVAEMCRYLRLPIVHDRELRVWHEGGQSTGRMLSRSVFAHQKDGFSYAFSRYESSYPEIRTRPNSVRLGVPDRASKSQPIHAVGDHTR